MNIREILLLCFFYLAFGGYLVYDGTLQVGEYVAGVGATTLLSIIGRSFDDRPPWRENVKLKRNE